LTSLPGYAGNFPQLKVKEAPLISSEMSELYSSRGELELFERVLERGVFDILIYSFHSAVDIFIVFKLSWLCAIFLSKSALESGLSARHGVNDGYSSDARVRRSAN
jgi:hypothetical protein